MHRFLRAVGFSNITTKQDMDKLLGITMDKPSVSKQILSKDGRKITELSREFAHNTGLTVRGEYDKLGFFHVDHYFPYCYSSLITMRTEVTINRRVDTSAFTGMCDDIRMAVSVIFYLQNSVDYIKLNFTDNTPHRANLALLGLSLTGRILLGIEKTDDSIERLRHETRMKRQLIIQAKNGDQDAIDNLTLDEIDLSGQLMKRIMTEDLYSIVDSTFIPYGSESDNYMIIGTILNWSLTTNPYTNEDVFQLLINCNDVVMNISINRKDLEGEPMIGRRFKGVIWMQGHADFISTSLV